MRVLVVDDEPLSRTALSRVLSRRRDVERFDVAEDGPQAIRLLKQMSYDVLLLDIQMPEMSGLELVDAVKRQSKSIPAVIFVTAYHEHAVMAFEKKALDYVLKPFAEERVQEALDQAVRRSAEERAARLLEMMTQLNAMPRQSTRIAMKVKGRILFVDLAELVAAEANGNYVLLQQRTGSWLLRESISVIAEKLKPYGFVRIHRSVLVNSAYVEAIKPCATGEYVLRTRTGKEYNVTRTYKENLRGLAQFWIGADAF
jgi:two-component system, LytTR family, response regulator